MQIWTIILFQTISTNFQADRSSGPLTIPCLLFELFSLRFSHSFRLKICFFPSGFTEYFIFVVDLENGRLRTQAWTSIHSTRVVLDLLTITLLAQHYSNNVLANEASHYCAAIIIYWQSAFSTPTLLFFILILLIYSSKSLIYQLGFYYLFIFQRSYIGMPVLHGKLWLDIWPSTCSIYKVTLIGNFIN